MFASESRMRIMRESRIRMHRIPTAPRGEKCKNKCHAKTTENQYILTPQVSCNTVQTRGQDCPTHDARSGRGLGKWCGCEVRCLRGRSVRVRSQGMLWWRLMDQMKARSILLFEPVAIAKAGVGQRFMYSKNGCYLLEGVHRKCSLSTPLGENWREVCPPVSMHVFVPKS